MLARFQRLPIHGCFNGVGTELVQNRSHVRQVCRPRGGIVYLRTKHQERLAFDDERRVNPGSVNVGNDGLDGA